MTDIMDDLAKAAARGVKVTILTNHHERPPITLAWRFWTTRDSGWGKFRGAGLDLVVQDCDGDSSWWELRRDKDVLAKGESDAWEPYYHFDTCLLAAEAALKVEVAARLTELRDRLTKAVEVRPGKTKAPHHHRGSH